MNAELRAEPLDDPEQLRELTEWGMRRARNTLDMGDDVRRAAVDARRSLAGLDVYDRTADQAYWRQHPEAAPGLWYAYLPFALID